MGVEKIVPSSLYLALSSERVPRVCIVKTLSDKDIDLIYKFKSQAKTALHLRMTAMIMLGLRMGLRGADIVNLKMTDVSWTDATIAPNFNQLA